VWEKDYNEGELGVLMMTIVVDNNAGWTDPYMLLKTTIKAMKEI